MNGAGGLSQQFTADGPVRRLLYYEEKNILITVSANMMLVQHSVAADGETREIIKVRMGEGKGEGDSVAADGETREIIKVRMGERKGEGDSVAADGEMWEIIKVRMGEGKGEGVRTQCGWDKHVVVGKRTLDGGIGWGHGMGTLDGGMGWGNGDAHGVR